MKMFCGKTLNDQGSNKKISEVTGVEIIKEFVLEQIFQ